MNFELISNLKIRNDQFINIYMQIISRTLFLECCLNISNVSVNSLMHVQNNLCFSYHIIENCISSWILKIISNYNKKINLNLVNQIEEISTEEVHKLIQDINEEDIHLYQNLEKFHEFILNSGFFRIDYLLLSQANFIFFKLFSEPNIIDKIFDRFLDGTEEVYLNGLPSQMNEYSHRRKNYIAGMACIFGYLNSPYPQHKSFFLRKISTI